MELAPSTDRGRNISLVTIQENILLKHYTTFRIGGPARFFVAVKNNIELTDALVFAQEKRLPIFVLGGGSNIVVGDEGFSGLVIKMEFSGIEYGDEKDGKIEVKVGAGEEWDTFVKETVGRGLHGLETLSYIPGTVGAAPVQNIGAYGSEVKTNIAWVEAMHIETGEFRMFSNVECEFTYRMSFFKKTEGRKYVITRVGFMLEKHGSPNISYKDIQTYIKENNITEITLQKVRDMVIAIRTKKLPSVKDYGTAGSFFKNPILLKEKYQKLLTNFPEMPHYPVDGMNVKIPAGWILDTLCGFKGYRDQHVGVYKNQALVLVNFGDATSFDVKKLAQKMIDCVKEKTGIELEREVEYV